MVIYRHNNTVQIKLEGIMSFTTIGSIKNQIYDFIQPDDRKVIMNLSKVDFVDSVGLGLLVSLLKHMKSQDGHIILEYPQLGVQKLMEMTRLDELFEIRKTPEKTTGSWSEFE